jgi:hypothetical protein
LQHARATGDHLVETLRGILTGELDDVVAHERHELDLVTVGVDDGMAELCADARHLVARDERHGWTLST